MNRHLHISLLGNEIAREGLKQLMGDRGFTVTTWPLNQLNLCIAGLPDATNQLVIVDAADDESGVALCRLIRKRLSDVSIMLLHDDVDRLEQHAAVSVDYPVARSAALHTLWEMLDRIARDADSGHATDPNAGEEAADNATAPYSLLSMREIEILFCLATGQTNKSIARQLDISDATVKVHVKTMLRKLSLANRTQAAIWALQHRMVSLDQGPDWTTPFSNGRAPV